MSQLMSFFKVLACSAILVLLILPLSAVIKANAASTTAVFIDPPSQQVNAVGDYFTVNVSISDVSNLYGYELEVYYNSTVMNGTQVTEGPFLNESGNYEPFFDIVSFTDNYNSTEGLVSVVCTLTGAVLGVSGGGVLVTIEFKSLALGNSIPLNLEDVQLSDPNSNPISYQLLSGGTVTIVPEFASPIAVVTLIAASLFAILIGKRARRAKSH